MVYYIQCIIYHGHALICFDWKTFRRGQNSLIKFILSIASVAKCIIALKLALEEQIQFLQDIGDMFYMFFIIQHNSHPGYHQKDSSATKFYKMLQGHKLQILIILFVWY